MESLRDQYYVLVLSCSQAMHIVSQIPLINKELSEVSNWFKANKLSVNVIKTIYMIIGTSKMTSTINQTDVILDNAKLDTNKN